MRQIDADKLWQEIRDDDLITGVAYDRIKLHINEAKTVAALGDCDDCGKARSCQYVPRPGSIVRINCPLWRAKG